MENPYESPTTKADESALPQSRAKLVPVAIALLSVSVLWFVMSLFGIVFFIASATAPDASPEHRHVELTYAGYLGAEALYCCILASGAFSMIRRGSSRSASGHSSRCENPVSMPHSASSRADRIVIKRRRICHPVQ